ncbi:MAG: transcriptional regulator, LuxR family [Marmoricola sp.]|nr:transcriptional regulator, LuxR family [Marmoricola sp.]
MAELLELDVVERNVAYYSGLLCWVGCHTDAYEQAKWFGDDIAAKRDSFRYDQGKPTQALAYAWRSVGAGQAPLAKARLWATLPLAARQHALVDLRNHWLAADELTHRLGLGDDVRQSLKESFERWDGKGAGGISGDEVRLTSRLVILADVVTAFYTSGGLDAAVTVARQRAGTHFDPDLVDLFCRHAGELMAGLDQASSWEEVLAAEPSLSRTLAEPELDEALRAMGDFADIKSPFTIGHSASVAGLTWAASAALEQPDEERVAVRRAAWVHDIGRLGVPNSIWDKPGPLNQSETERVHLHPYLTERMLAGTPALARLGAIAVQHHERLDGSGYPRGLTGAATTLSGRILASADTFATMTEPRPHRPAMSGTEAAALLRQKVSAGQLDADATGAVLEAAGHRAPRRREWPAGLTAREVEVLRLLALGLSNKQIADQLTISHKTAGSHVEHIYTKTGVRNRAGVALFAMKHALMNDY